MSVLIVGAEKSPYLQDVEKNVFELGFKTLLVVGSNDAIEKCRTELFNVIIYDLNCLDLDGINFLEQISLISFAAVTPVIILKNPKDKREINHLSSVLDHAFDNTTSSEMVAEYVKETAELRRKKVKKGSLANVPVPRILYDANTFKFTGAAIFERQQEKKIIYFDEGRLIFASSNKPNERFGEFMVEQGLISKDHLAQALQISQKSNLKFGQILVEMGHINKDTLVPLLQSQIKHILYSIFDWEEGDFFILFDQPASIIDVPAKFRTPALITEGIKRKYNTNQLMLRLNPLSRRVRLDKKWKSIIAEFPVTRMEFRVIDQMEDGIQLDDILKTSPLSELETLRLLFLLYIVNLIRLGEGAKVIDMQKYAQKDSIGDAIEEHKYKEEVTGEDDKKEIEKEAVKDKGRIVEISEEKPFDDYKTNVVEVRGAKLKKSGSLRKIFLTVILISLFWVAGFYLYVNDFFGLDKYFRKDDGTVVATTPVPTIDKTANVTPPVIKKKLPKKIRDKVATKKVAPFPIITETETPSVEATPEPTAAAEPTVAVIEPKIVASAYEKRKRQLAAFNKHFRRGKKDYDDGKLLSALDEYKQCYEINPGSDKLLVEMGKVYFDMDRSIEAIEKYKQAIKINPKNAKAHLNLGNAYQYHKKNRLAIQEYNKFLSLEPDSRYSVEVRRILQKMSGE